MGYNGVQEIEGLNYEKRSKRTVHVKKKIGRKTCMRTITKEYLSEQKKESNPLSYILNTPKPDFTQMHKENLEFEKSMQKAQEEDRKKILEVLQK